MNVFKAFAGSRKFWLAIAALAVCTVFVALGKIDSTDFLTMVLGIVGGLGTLIGAEDMAEKHGRNVPARTITTINAGTASPPAAGETVTTVTESKTVAVESADSLGTSTEGKPTRSLRPTPPAGTEIPKP